MNFKIYSPAVKLSLAVLAIIMIAGCTIVDGNSILSQEIKERRRLLKMSGCIVLPPKVSKKLRLFMRAQGTISSQEAA